MTSYNGREIKTKEDVLWMCQEVKKVYESGNVGIKDVMALSHLEEILEEEYRKNPINNRWEILDI